MANRITATSIKSLFSSGKVGKHSIGNGLYVRISKERTITIGKLL